MKGLKCCFCGCRFTIKVIDGMPPLERLREHAEEYHREHYLALKCRVWQAVINRLPNELRPQV